MTMEPATTKPRVIEKPAIDGMAAFRAAYVVMMRRGRSPFASAVRT